MLHRVGDYVEGFQIQDFQSQVEALVHAYQPAEGRNPFAGDPEAASDQVLTHAEQVLEAGRTLDDYGIQTDEHGRGTQVADGTLLLTQPIEGDKCAVTLKTQDTAGGGLLVPCSAGERHVRIHGQLEIL